MNPDHRTTSPTGRWPALAKALGGTLSLLFDRTILLLGAVFVASVVLMFWFVSDHQRRLVETQALAQAADYTRALAEFRTLYTSSVVATAQAHGLEVTHDFATREGAIPLPATLSMLLGDSLTALGGGSTRLYSAYPFPWRREAGGLRSPFEERAWDSLRRAPDVPFYRFETEDGRVLRYATADVMRPSCVNCHNTHPDSPKRDWREGDVRGVLEVTVPLDAAMGQLRWGLGGTFAFLALVTGLGLSGLVLVVRRSAGVILRLRSRVTQLGQYTLDEEIGSGGMGVVYRARHALLRRPTAVKLLPPERSDTGTVRLFEREVQAASQLSHPNTIAIYDYGRTPEGTFYYAMEYVEGLTLAELIADDGPQSEARVIHILRQALGSLAEAHAADMVHRDIKPSNLMLCRRGGVDDVVKLLDFGLVRRLDPGKDSLVGVDPGLGTPLYLPPEAIRQESLDPRSDLYQLGAVAYFLLTASHVFWGHTVLEVCRKHLHVPPMPPSEWLGRPIAHDLERLVLACLEKERENRPADARALDAGLAACKDAAGWTPARAEEWWAAWSKRPSKTRPAAEPAPAGGATMDVDFRERIPGR